MNYCSIEDAWKNSDSLTDQFKLKKKTIENFSSDNNISTPIKIDNEEYYNTFDYNKDTFDYNKDSFDYNKDTFDFKIDNDFINDINKSSYGHGHNHSIKQNNSDTSNTNNTNNYQNVFICDDFLDHLETCKVCRMKMRNRFRSNIVEKFDNLIVDNKDTVLLFLLILFALIFCNLVITIFK
jgi:hypothetical protein